jgi:TonB-linked SusC/RagA family outer membrane protein
MKKIFSVYLVLALWCLCSGVALAQKVLIRGVIMDGTFNEPMYGASVVWQNKDGRTVGGMQSNFDGSFSLQEMLKPGDVLVVSFTGYGKESVPITSDRTVYNITLKEETVALKSVEIQAARKTNAGMMNINERDMTTASKKIDMTELEDLAVADVTDALQGRVAGVDMVATSGAPGSGMSIRIRGTTSINGSSEPLIVLDGFPYETTISNDFDFSTADENDYATMLNIAPDDIKEITVLKDAAATAIYGSKGANGVLLITTKRGAVSKPTISYSFKGSISKPGDGIPMLSGDEYKTLIMDELFNAGKVFNGNAYQELADDANNLYNYYNYGQNTNWYDAVTQTGYTQDHSIAISGGSAKAKYRASLNYYDADGTTIGESYQRLQTRVNLDYNISEKLTFSASMTYNYNVTDRNYVTYLKSSSNVLSQAFNRAPNMGIYAYDETGTLTNNYFTPAADLSGAYWAGSYSNPYNPVAMANDGFYSQKTNRILPNMSLQWRPLNWLRYQLDVSFDVFNNKDNAFVPQSATGRPWTETSVNVAQDRDQESFAFQTYNKLFFTPNLGEDHSLQVMVGLNTSDTRAKGVALAVSNTASTELTDPSNGGLVAGTSSNLSSYSNEVRSVSLIGQVQYSYLDRYILGLACNYEGSSKFGDGNRWAMFPSVSGRWRFSDEEFLKDWGEKIKLSEGSLRFSYGESGSSRALGNYASQATYYTYGFTYLGNKGTAQSGLELANLKWEKTKSFNVGLDLGFWENRLNAHLEWYYKSSDQLIVTSRAIPTSTGFATAAYLNNAGMKNKGIEFDADYVIFRNKDWNIKVSGNFARNENELKDDLETTGYWNTNTTSGTYPTLLLAGQPLGSFYGYIYEGVYLNSDETIARDANGNKIYTYNDKGEREPVYMRFNYPTADYVFQPGDAKYKDVNNDGNINEQDVVYLGNGMPLFTGGFGLNAKWKNLSLNTFFNFRYGNDIVNMAKASMESMRGYGNQARSVLRRWTHEYTEEQIANGEVPSGLLPRAVYGIGYNSLASSRYVEDGSFLRFKTATLSYTFPKKWYQGTPLSDVRCYFQMSNIYCWTSYTGMDPEVSISSPTAPGYDTSNTPRPREYTLGINVKF